MDTMTKAMCLTSGSSYPSGRRSEQYNLTVIPGRVGEVLQNAEARYRGTKGGRVSCRAGFIEEVASELGLE